MLGDKTVRAVLHVDPTLPADLQAVMRKWSEALNASLDLMQYGSREAADEADVLFDMPLKAAAAFYTPLLKAAADAGEGLGRGKKNIGRKLDRFLTEALLQYAQDDDFERRRETSKPS